jgi:predicted  nucleic acid-binding Zn-ribbon protein
MNKWINISIIGVLVAGLAASLVFYFQESGNLKDAQDVIVNLEGDISTLDGIVSTLGTDLAAAEAEVTRLEEDLATAEAQVSTLEADLAAAEGQVSVLEGNVSTLETDLAAAEGQVAVLEGNVSTLETDLAAAEAQVSTLEAELADAEAQVATLTEELAKVKDPGHFTSLQELEAWLAQDDTDTAYPFLSTAELAFILQVRALRDGYLLPAEVYAGGVGLNVAYIGSDIYLVSPEDDFTIWWDTMDSLPSHPLPLS